MVATQPPAASGTQTQISRS